MNRGDIYWVDLNPTTGSEIQKVRPCILIGATPINKARHTILVVPLSTSGIPRPPLVISLQCKGKTVVAVCDQLRAVDKSRLGKQIGSLSNQDMELLENGLRQVLSL
jgi:mRNA interferase MazF